jgi:hypothetical protein
MNRAAIYEAIQGYLKIMDGSGASEDRLDELALALDRLALAYHFAHCEFEDSDLDAPRDDYAELRRRASALIADPSPYNMVLDVSVNIGETEIGVGDTIDDLADIASDMQKVLWLWDHASVEIALWEFRWGYENHWGEHLRYLQLYLWESKRGT